MPPVWRAPWVGLKPTTPQSAAGVRIDPPVSDPRATGQSRAATDAADPPLAGRAVLAHAPDRCL